MNDMIIREALYQFKTPFYLYEEENLTAAIEL